MGLWKFSDEFICVLVCAQVFLEYFSKLFESDNCQSKFRFKTVVPTSCLEIAKRMAIMLKLERFHRKMLQGNYRYHAYLLTIKGICKQEASAAILNFRYENPYFFWFASGVSEFLQ